MFSVIDEARSRNPSDSSFAYDKDRLESFGFINEEVHKKAKQVYIVYP